VRGPTLYQKFCTSKLKKRRTASSVWRLARAAAASGAVSSPAPAAGSPSGRANVTMSEAEGGWSDLLQLASRRRKLFHFVMWRMS